MAGKADHPEVATTALHGPDGARVDVDEHLPGSWPRDYVDHLVETKAARKPRKNEKLKPRSATVTVAATMRARA